MITYLRFMRPINIGSVDHDEWSKDRPNSSALVNKITPRLADRSKGEGDGVVLEYRAGIDNYDVEVPRSNIAQITRAVKLETEKKK